MDIDKDTGVAGLVGAGEVDGRGASGATSPSDGDLVAGHVKLGTAGRHGGVKRNRLCADEVVAVGELRPVSDRRASWGVLGPSIHPWGSGHRHDHSTCSCLCCP